MQPQETTLAKVICFDLGAITLWSGRRKLRRADLKLQDEAEIPPEAIASLGSKKIIDPDEIADFEAMKKEAHRECAKIGIRFLSGYAVPEDSADALASTLEDIGKRFSDQKTSFLADYERTIADWIAQHPEWSSMLNEAALTRTDVEAKLNFGWRAFRVVAADDNTDSAALNKGLSSELTGLAGQLYREVAQAAGQVQEKSLMGRDRVSQKILSPIRTIRGKLHGLSFLDNRVGPLIDTIDHVMSQLPKAGWIDGLGLSALHGLVFILSDEARMTSHGQAIIDGKNVAEAFDDSTPGGDESDKDDALADLLADEMTQPQDVVQSPAPSLGDLFAPRGEQSQPTNLNSVLVPPPAVKPAQVFRLFD